MIGVVRRLVVLTMLPSFLVVPHGASASVDPVAAVGSSGATTSVSCDDSSAVSPIRSSGLDGYQPINPRRLVDTRDGTGGFAGQVGAGCTLVVELDDATVPAGATAVALSLTAVAPESGWAVAFACGAGRPATSSLNFRPERIAVANLAPVALGDGRAVCLYASSAAHLIVDLAGWWSDGPNRFSSIEPVRAYDTRQLPGAVRVRGGETRGIKVGGVHIPAGATAATINLTVVGSDRPGYAVVFPCGFQAPLASNVNFVAREARAVAAIVGLDSNGGLCVRPSVDVHVVVDVAGYYEPGTTFGPAPELVPEVGTRLVDTRNATGPWDSKFGPGQVRSLDPGGADNTLAVLLNVVATKSDGPGWVALFPCGGVVPTVSTVNFYDPGPATNLAVVELGDDGSVCAKASIGTHVVIDRVGYVAPPDGGLAARLEMRGREAFPAFDPDGTDHAVVCGAGPTKVVVDIEVVPGARARIDGQPVADGATAVTVPQDGLFTVELARQQRKQTYFFRCVPPDFPVLDVERTGDPAPGWYLTTFGMGGPPVGSFLAVLDHRGAPVWFKRVDRPSIDLKSWSGGRLAYTPLLGGPFGVNPTDGYRLTDLTGANRGELLTTDPSVLPVDHHDMVEAPGGGHALISYPLVDGYDLTAIGFGSDETIADSVVEEIDAGGNRTWFWRMSDHLPVRPDVVPFARRFPERGVDEVDLFHVNSLQRLADGDFVVSARHTDAAMRIDRATGEIEWSVGGEPPAPGPDPMRRLTIVGDALGGPRRPHDARLHGDVLTLFDNRTATGQPARAVAYRIDEAAGTATLLWQVDEPLGRSSDGLGSVRAQPDGSWVIAWGGLQPMFGEVAADGSPLMAISQVPAGNSYRIVKLPVGAFDIDDLRSNAGGQLEPVP
jgi:hypothetical protein